jgi:hypothetical protein
MLTVLGTPRRCCDGLTRRESLRAGALGVLGGFGLPQLLQAEQEGRVRPRRRARSVIVLYLLGGAATQDMVDLKPNAPAEVRGEFRPIATRVPGLQVCEHLPRMARWANRLAVVRSLNHRAGCHNPLPSYTGYAEPVTDLINPRDTYPPSMGSVCEALRQISGDLPDYVYLPCYLGWGQAIRRPGPYAGFLGSRSDPLFTECDPYKDAGTPAARPGFPQVVRGEPRLPQAGLAIGITVDRLNSRRGLLGQIDDRLRHIEAQPALGNHSRVQHRAFTLLTSSPARAAFDLSRESPRLRDRYGRTLFGSSTLIARRLVEAGVRFVNVTCSTLTSRMQGASPPAARPARGRNDSASPARPVRGGTTVPPARRGRPARP